MTDVGAALLKLLADSPGEWEYAPVCEGLRHLPTGVLLAPSIPGRVVLLARGESRTAVLSDDDHAALYRHALPLVERGRTGERVSHHAVLCELLKLEPK